MAKKLPPTFEEREEFLKRIMSTDQCALRLRQFMEQALCHLHATGSIRDAERLADCAMGAARDMAHDAINRVADRGTTKP